jgi:hypothetical protein
MAKGRDRGHREAKKPKADKKPSQAGATFLRPQPPSKPPTVKDPAKQQ